MFSLLPLYSALNTPLHAFMQRSMSSASTHSLALAGKDRASARTKDSDKKVSPMRLSRRVLHVRSVARVTKGGKIRSTTALVIVGNGQGLGGYGEGRAKDYSAAVEKATMNATKSLMPVARFQQRTIFGDTVHRFQSVKLDMKTAPPGFGIVANNNIHEICRLVGIRDLACKVHGSHNPINVVKATFEALRMQQTPQELARLRGRKLVDIANTYYGGNV